MRSGMPIPKSITNAPELYFGLQLFMVAFMDLESHRPVGFGVAPIPHLAIHDYCDRYEIGEELREDMLHHIRMMDQTYREYHSNKD